MKWIKTRNGTLSTRTSRGEWLHVIPTVYNNYEAAIETEFSFLTVGTFRDPSEAMKALLGEENKVIN